MTLRRGVGRLVALTRKTAPRLRVGGRILAHLELAERDAVARAYRRRKPAAPPAAASEESNK